jgi:hypothetical protein
VVAVVDLAEPDAAVGAGAVVEGEVVGTVRVSESPDASSGGVAIGPNGPPRNRLMVCDASSGCTTSTSDPPGVTAGAVGRVYACSWEPEKAW